MHPWSTLPRSGRYHDPLPQAVESPPVAEPGTPISLVLADDHVVVRRGLRMLLEQVPEMEVVAEASDAREAVESAAGGGADVLVLDLNMPGGPLDVLAEMAATDAGTAVVVLTMEQDAAFARRALDAGARAYVLKRAAGEELVDAIRAVAAGGTHVSPEIERQLDRRGAEVDSPGDLTGRESQVLSLIARGHTNAEVADMLSLSVRTVETHRTRIQQKLGVSSRPELVRYALTHELI